MHTESHGRAKYFVTFIDDHSGWCEVRFLNKKNEVFAEFKKVRAFFEKQTGESLKCLQSDNGTEYLNNAFNDFMNSNGIRRRLTVANNPEQNGKAERRNRTLLEMAKYLLIQSGLPNFFWAEAIMTANFIRNRCSSKSLDSKTPYEMWHGKRPRMDFFREFGCKVYVLDRISHKEKFDSKTKSGIFLGYSDQSKGYRIWIPEERKVEIARDVKFMEDASPLTPTSSRSRPLEIQSDIPKIDIPSIKAIPEDGDIDEEEDTDTIQRR